MKIIKANTHNSETGSSEYFTGKVTVDSLYNPDAPSQLTTAQVTFEPGARTVWHTHPLGQILIVTAGSGYVQCKGKEIETINPGDVVYFEPNEKHWHGATEKTKMTHIAIQEKKDGTPVQWMEHVTEEEYPH